MPRHLDMVTANMTAIIGNSQEMTTAERSRRNGQIITFYSYKGGVGRSRALANVAYQLACNGKKVLCIDFDLEAPGLMSYFRKWVSESDDEINNQLGVIDIFQSYKEYILIPNPFRTILDWSELVPIDF